MRKGHFLFGQLKLEEKVISIQLFASIPRKKYLNRKKFLLDAQDERLTGFALWRLQMKGLLVKRMTYFKRRFFLFTVMVKLFMLVSLH
jgi:hypothetical protein